MNNPIQSVSLIFSRLYNRLSRVYTIDLKFISKEDFLSKQVVSETTCFEIKYFQVGWHGKMPSKIVFQFDINPF